MGGLKWTRKSTTKIARELQAEGIEVSPKTVGRLLRQMNYSLRVNQKKLESGNRNPPSRQQRDSQFQYISHMRDSFIEARQPIISIDTKKKELIGNFRNAGSSWVQEPVAVMDHDFRSDASAIAVPYGIYDCQNNRGLVCVGTSADTPAFAVDAIQYWWVHQRPLHFPNATELLILADCGGSNGHRARVFKWRLHQQLCLSQEITVTLCHYPPGASKWNPIEHRLFSEISKNWQGQPLRTVATMLNYIRTTQTASGLSVSAHFMRRKYKKGERVSDKQFNRLPLRRDQAAPNWNYTLEPALGKVIFS
jgi:Rhodopirellula transposase DDE domain